MGIFNPAQQAIMDCENLDKVILTSPYSCGKTTVLTERTLKLDKKGEKVLFINGTGTRSQSTTKSLMSLELEEQFKKVPNVSFMTLSSREIVKLTEPFNKYKLHDIPTEFMQKFKDQNYHLIIDEFILQTKGKMGTRKEIQETSKVFNELAKHFRSVWICLSRGYLSQMLFEKSYDDYFSQIESWFPGWNLPKMQYPLRGGSEIVEFVKTQNNTFLLKQQWQNNGKTQLPTLHIGSMKIPENLCTSYKVEVFEGEEAIKMIEDLDFSAVFEKMGAENNFLIIIEENFFNILFHGGSNMKRQNQPIFYHTARKDNQSHVKDWTKGNKKCDLITDIFHAAGFEAEFVIVFGSRTSLSAASRATSKLAIIDIESYLKKMRVLSKAKSRIIPPKSHLTTTSEKGGQENDTAPLRNEGTIDETSPLVESVRKRGKNTGTKPKLSYNSFSCRAGHRVNMKSQPGVGLGTKCSCGEVLNREYKKSKTQVCN